MKIGVPKEIKNHEYRVGMTPESVAEAVHHGHTVLVERQAGAGIGASDEDYLRVGAAVVDSAEEVFATADMIVKVKEPQAKERALLREGQILFTYLHLAPDPEQTRDLVDSGAVCIAYETVTDSRADCRCSRPCRGRRSAVDPGGAPLPGEGHGGRGMLLGGVPGVAPAKVVIIGGGVVGTHAAHIADRHGRRRTWSRPLPNALKRCGASSAAARHGYSHARLDRQYVLGADLVIGAVLVPGAAAPKLVSRGDAHGHAARARWW